MIKLIDEVLSVCILIFGLGVFSIVGCDFMILVSIVFVLSKLLLYLMLNIILICWICLWVMFLIIFF